MSLRVRRVFPNPYSYAAMAEYIKAYYAYNCLGTPPYNLPK